MGADTTPGNERGFHHLTDEQIDSIDLKPRIQALADSMVVFGRAVQRSIEATTEIASHFGLLVKRTHRDGRWRQHMKLRMIAEGYRLTRHGWQQ